MVNVLLMLSAALTVADLWAYVTGRQGLMAYLLSAALTLTLLTAVMMQGLLW